NIFLVIFSFFHNLNGCSIGRRYKINAPNMINENENKPSNNAKTSCINIAEIRKYLQFLFGANNAITITVCNIKVPHVGIKTNSVVVTKLNILFKKSLKPIIGD